MHELSIALSLLDVAAEQAEQIDVGSVVALHVRIGALSGVVPEALELAYEAARHATPFSRTGLRIEVVPGIMHCPACGVDREIDQPQWPCCPECGTTASSVLGGRELDLVGLEVEA